MIFLNSMIAEGHQEEALNYIENLQEGMKKIQQKCYDVGNEVINTMLNYYLESLDEGVSVSISGKCTKKIDISQAELCIIISNLIKNTVEALKYQKKERYLKILFNTGNENLKIEIINSTVQNDKRDKKKDNKNEFPETIKKDKKNHGIGLRNVKETVEKNHGIFYWEQDKTCFKVKVILPCKK